MILTGGKGGPLVRNGEKFIFCPKKFHSLLTLLKKLLIDRCFGSAAVAAVNDLRFLLQLSLEELCNSLTTFFIAVEVPFTRKLSRVISSSPSYF